MLSFEDCLSLCELTEDEVHAIAEHEHITEMAAAALGDYLVSTPEGEQCIKRMILDDIASALAGGRRDHGLALKLVMRNFVVRHPRCDERRRAGLHLHERRLAGKAG